MATKRKWQFNEEELGVTPILDVELMPDYLVFEDGQLVATSNPEEGFIGKKPSYEWSRMAGREPKDKRKKLAHTLAYTPDQDDIGYELHLEIKLDKELIPKRVSFEKVREAFELLTKSSKNKRRKAKGKGCSNTADTEVEEVAETSGDVVAPVPITRDMSSLTSRFFVPAKGDDAEALEEDDAGEFKVMNFNVLAQSLLHKDVYGNPAWSFNFKSRHDHIVKMVELYKPDVLTFQEAEPKYFIRHVQPCLNKKGYAFVFLKKENDDNHDGVCIGFKEEKIEWMDIKKEIIFKKRAEKDLQMKQYKDLEQKFVEQLCDQVHVGLAVKLNLRGKGPFWIVNTHLPRDCNKRSDNLSNNLKVYQVLHLAEVMRKLDGPIVLCGDMNTKPMSTIYKYFRNMPVDFAEITTGNYRTIVEGQRMLGIDMASASKFLQGHPQSGVFSEEPVFTHVALGYHKDFTKDRNSKNLSSHLVTYDYIFHTVDKLECVGGLTLVDVDAIHKAAGIPNENFPSDHLALVAVFRPRGDWSCEVKGGDREFIDAG